MYLQSNREKKTPRKLKLKDNSQNIWPELINIVKVINDKERMRSYHKLEQIKGHKN
jgi:hypothetical protein